MSLLQFDPAAPCPCGKERPGQGCCVKRSTFAEADGRGRVVGQRLVWALEIPQADTRPLRPRTGYAHPKCYARTLNDCSEKITGEHYLSAVVLRRITNAEGYIDVGGAAWKPGLTRLRVEDLVTRKLCERHNRTLSPLDAVAGRVFDGFFDMGRYLEDGRDLVVGVNGHDFERWLLKYLCGLLAVARQEIAPLWLNILFGEYSFLPPRGLYVYAIDGDVLRGDKIQLEIAQPEGEPVIGSRVRLMSADFMLAMTERPPAAADQVGKLRIPRPGGFEFVHERTGARFVLAFSWQNEASNAVIRGTWAPASTAAPITHA
jgi:hypothetical protein